MSGAGGRSGNDHGAKGSVIHCTGCGRPATECAGGCTSDLDPPRFCSRCGRRLAVQVFPGHVVVRCPAGAGH